MKIIKYVINAIVSVIFSSIFLVIIFFAAVFTVLLLVFEEIDLYFRKKRQNKINFNNNPLDIPNITSHTEWEVLKNPSIFKNDNSILKTKNIFTNKRR